MKEKIYAIPHPYNTHEESMVIVWAHDWGYEWEIREEGKTVKTTKRDYGNAEIALRDALNEATEM